MGACPLKLALQCNILYITKGFRFLFEAFDFVCIRCTKMSGQIRNIKDLQWL